MGNNSQKFKDIINSLQIPGWEKEKIEITKPYAVCFIFTREDEDYLKIIIQEGYDDRNSLFIEKGDLKIELKGDLAFIKPYLCYTYGEEN